MRPYPTTRSGFTLIGAILHQVPPASSQVTSKVAYVWKYRRLSASSFILVRLLLFMTITHTMSLDIRLKGAILPADRRLRRSTTATKGPQIRFYVYIYQRLCIYRDHTRNRLTKASIRPPGDTRSSERCALDR